jgi:hypothetical protein
MENVYDRFKHLSGTTEMMSYDKLIAAIEQLETDGVISFNEFKELPLFVIRKHFFQMTNSTMMRKAIIKLEDKRQGKTGPSEYTTVTIIETPGKPTKTIIKTEKF